MAIHCAGTVYVGNLRSDVTAREVEEGEPKALSLLEEARSAVITTHLPRTHVVQSFSDMGGYTRCSMSTGNAPFLLVCVLRLTDLAALDMCRYG